MKDKIIKIIESYFDNYMGLKTAQKALEIDDLPEIAEEIEQALIWHGPDVAPPKAGPLAESILVLNQSGEKVGLDLLSNEWFNWDMPTRLAKVEKWRYPEPKKIKQ